MFATLDPTLRSVELPSKRSVLLSDTVGFIRNLPHTLVSAFRATLEEVQRATLVLQVSDASNALSAEQDAQVDKVLKELEADGKPRVHVMNKIDLLPEAERDGQQNNERTVYVSAAKGLGIDALLKRIDDLLQEDRPSRVRLKIPQKEGKLLAMLEAKAVIIFRTYREGNVHLEVEAPESVLRKVKEFVK
jgi:GTP-binding protein HflX